MTDLLSRPILRVDSADDEPIRPIAISAAVASCWVAAVGLLVCIVTSVVAWFSASSGRFGSAVEVGALAWLVGNGSGVHLGDVTVTAIPVGFLAVVCWMLYRSGRWAGANSVVRSGADAALGAAVMAATYAGIALLTAAMARPGNAMAGQSRLLACTLLAGLVFGGLGVARGSGLADEVDRRLPEAARAALVGGLAGAGALVMVAALVTTVSMLAHFSSAVRVAESMHAGMLGGLIMAAVGMLVVPNAVLCAVSFVAGPGFVVGAGTGVSPDSVVLGPLPNFPLLAALPRSGQQEWWATALVAAPVLAGALAAAVALRPFPVFGVDRAALRGGTAGLVGGLLLGASTWLATGAVGPGRMQEIGPDVPATTLVLAVALGLGGATAGAASTWLSSLWSRRRRASGEPGRDGSGSH